MASGPHEPPLPNSLQNAIRAGVYYRSSYDYSIIFLKSVHELKKPM
jgi:hypothetical protein